MPATQQDRHPSGLLITFEEEGHKYYDSWDREYTSVTTLLHDYFPKFNAKEKAAEIAVKRGTTPQALIAEWDRNRDEACAYGTRVHENAEWRMKGGNQAHTPLNAKEVAAFETAAATVDYLKTQYQFIAAEKIVFSPRYRIAGTIDLLMSDGQRLIIFDYKTNKLIRMSSDFNQWGDKPIQHLPDCEFTKYTLQLSLVEFLMRQEGYLPEGALVDREIVHFPPMERAGKRMKTPYWETEIKDLILDFATRGFEDVPF